MNEGQNGGSSSTFYSLVSCSHSSYPLSLSSVCRREMWCNVRERWQHITSHSLLSIYLIWIAMESWNEDCVRGAKWEGNFWSSHELEERDEVCASLPPPFVPYPFSPSISLHSSHSSHKFHHLSPHSFLHPILLCQWMNYVKDFDLCLETNNLSFLSVFSLSRLYIRYIM